MKQTSYLLVSMLIIGIGCGPAKKATRYADKSVTANIRSEGFFDCFEKGLTAGGQPVWCEASAILFDGTKILLANDKDMPDNRSSVFYWPFLNGFADTSRGSTYLTEPAFKKAKKFEDFAFTPDGKLIFLSTAFDRIKPDSRDWNGYNTIFYWQTGEENMPTVLTDGAPDTTSISLRDRFSKTLRNTAFPNGVPYFKIEGLAATNDMLYFGIREEGKKFDDFTYQFKILAVNYTYSNKRVELGKNIRVLADIDLKTRYPDLEKGMGISSIEFDRFNNRFLMLSSFEGTDKMGGYLWTATLEELGKNQVHLVKDEQGKPLAFHHKPEDLTSINTNRILVIHDDDRMITKNGNQTRQSNQAAYSVVDFK
ncbi:MAG: hypothetical protein ABI581_16965 [Sediminibacterium sp.]